MRHTIGAGATARRADRRLLGLGIAAMLLAGACSTSSATPSATPAPATPTLTAAASAAPTAAPSAAPSATLANLTIAFNMGAAADPFFQAMHTGAAAAAKELGVTLLWQGDPKEYSPATQIPIVDQLLAQHPNALIISPTDPDALQPAVNKAIAAGVTVLNVDTHVTDLSKVLTFITGDNEQGGTAAADAMATAMKYTAGQEYQVVVGASSATTTTNTARLEGFKKQIAAKYPGIKIVSTAYSQSQAATANTNVNNWLTQFPNLKGIFAIDGTNATGAAAALQARKLVGKIALVGYDAYPTNVELLKKGVFIALIAQDPAQEGYQTVKDAVQFLRTGSKDGIQAAVTLPNIVLTPTSSADQLTKYTYPSS